MRPRGKRVKEMCSQKLRAWQSGNFVIVVVFCVIVQVIYLEIYSNDYMTGIAITDMREIENKIRLIGQTKGVMHARYT